MFVFNRVHYYLCECVEHVCAYAEGITDIHANI